MSHDAARPEHPLDDDDYRALAAFRTELRRFLSFSEGAARAAGITPQQHQALLAIRGHPGPRPPSVTDVATALLLQTHSATELVARTEAAGLLNRGVDPDDRRRTTCRLTPQGHRVLAHLTEEHRRELVRLRVLIADLDRLDRPAP